MTAPALSPTLRTIAAIALAGSLITTGCVVIDPGPGGPGNDVFYDVTFDAISYSVGDEDCQFLGDGQYEFTITVLVNGFVESSTSVPRITIGDGEVADFLDVFADFTVVEGDIVTVECEVRFYDAFGANTETRILDVDFEAGFDADGEFALSPNDISCLSDDEFIFSIFFDLV